MDQATGTVSLQSAGYFLRLCPQQRPPAAYVASAAGTGNGALNAINAVNAAVQALGSVQGIVGAGENDLNYAIGLANSQITNFSAAESGIRDADVARKPPT